MSENADGEAVLGCCKKQGLEQLNSGCFADCLDQAWKWGGCLNGSGCIAQSRGDLMCCQQPQWRTVPATGWYRLGGIGVAASHPETNHH